MVNYVKMVDANAKPCKSRTASNDDFQLAEVAELLFLAYRDFTGDSGLILAELGFGRAHHRAFHFIGRHPDITVTSLLKFLCVTKQSLAQVLWRLLQEGLVEQHTDEGDRRRPLFLGTAGKTRLERLSVPLRRRISRALDSQGCDPFPLWCNILLSPINENDRDHVLELINGKSS